MSDKESKKDHDKTATNRLLELLRSQQAGGTPDEKEKVETRPVSQDRPEPEQPSEEPESAPTVSKRTDKREEQAPAGTQARDMMAKFRTSMKVKTLERTDSETKTPSREDVDESMTGGTPGDAEAERQRPSSQDLLQNLKPETGEKEPEVEVEPAVFDDSLFSVFTGKNGGSSWKLFLNTIYHFLDGSSSFLSVQAGDKTLILLQFSLTLKGVRAKDYSIFTLPYVDGTTTLNTMAELLPRALDLFVDKKLGKKLFIAYHSSGITATTLVIQTPQLKGNELEDLIKWNLKKKHSIDTEKTLIQWEVLTGTPSAGKQNVVVVTVPRDEVNPALQLFRDKKLALRYHSALPILLWKSFIRNYPDCNRGCHVLVHIGENTTDVMFIVDHQLLFSRDIALGIEDLYSAIMQKVVVGDSTVEIDYPDARKIIRDYGIPVSGKGIIPESKISLYKLSIYLRPVVERLTNELNRSLKYFNKQYPDVEWEELIFDGPGAVVPNLLTTLHNNLNVKVGLFNPKRTFPVQSAPGVVIPEDQLPAVNLNFAMASGNARTMNLLPSNLLLDNKFIFFNKLSAAIAIVLIPLFIGSGFMKYRELERVDNEVDVYQDKWTLLATETRDYYDLSNDCDILNSYPRYLKNDKVYSQNQIQLLRVFSSIVSSDIKFTSMVFSRDVKPAAENSAEVNKLGDILDIKGFIQSDASVADIRMTNFVIKLEEMDMFSKVAFKMDENSKPKDGKLFFKINLKMKS